MNPDPMTPAPFKRVIFEQDRLRTLEEVADALGVSRERVRQLEVQALRKVRLALERRGIDEQLVREWLNELPTTEREW